MNLNIKNSVVCNNQKVPLKRPTQSQEDYRKVYAHGKTGMLSFILEDQSIEYYDGVREGVMEYEFLNVD